jgi:carbonic anhydrase
MRLLLIVFICLVHCDAAALTPKEALKRLVEGNQRYVNERLEHPNRSQESRRAVKKLQEPFAVILGCSDSRVSPEILFDQGIGDLFVVRVAGNVVGPVELDSVEYSALALGSKLVLVLGHDRCGAIKAVLNGKTESIEAVANLIKPAIDSIDRKSPNALEEAIKANVNQSVKNILQSSTIAKLVKEGSLEVVGGYYDLATGEVKIIR